MNRFDFESFGWLLPQEIHDMVADYCRTGVDAANFCCHSITSCSYQNIAFDNNDNIVSYQMPGVQKFEIDKNGYQVVRDGNGYILVRQPDGAVHILSYKNVVDMSVHPCEQKLVFIDYDGRALVEWGYKSGLHSATTKYTNDVARMKLVAYRRSGIVFVDNLNMVVLLTPQYTCGGTISCAHVRWIGVDAHDQIIIAQSKSILLYTADSNQCLMNFTLSWGQVTHIGAISRRSGALVFLDIHTRSLLKYSVEDTSNKKDTYFY